MARKVAIGSRQVACDAGLALCSVWKWWITARRLSSAASRFLPFVYPGRDGSYWLTDEQMARLPSIRQAHCQTKAIPQQRNRALP